MKSRLVPVNLVTPDYCELDTMIHHRQGYSAHLGYDTAVKPEQREVVNAFVRGNDVFASLPTGYGKSLLFRHVAFSV